MKTLTVRQPWASLEVHGIKPIENRTWQTKYRGPLLIHAAAKCAGRTSQLVPNIKKHDPFDGSIFTDAQWDAMGEEMRVNMALQDWPLGAIIGKVDLVDIVINHPSIWAEKTPFCPITGLKYFCDIEDGNGNIVPTYGGPFDSYTIPYPDETAKGEYVRSRFDHDYGYWKGEENIVKKTNIPRDRRPIYNWVLKNPVLFPEPILNVKGKLSLWEYELPENYSIEQTTLIATPTDFGCVVEKGGV